MQLFRSARQISLVDEHTLVLPTDGSVLDSKRKVLPGCMQGADVDGDGQIELVVADACGFVYGNSTVFFTIYLCFTSSVLVLVNTILYVFFVWKEIVNTKA